MTASLHHLLAGKFIKFLKWMAQMISHQNQGGKGTEFTYLIEEFSAVGYFIRSNLLIFYFVTVLV